MSDVTGAQNHPEHEGAAAHEVAGKGAAAPDHPQAPDTLSAHPRPGAGQHGADSASAHPHPEQEGAAEHEVAGRAVPEQEHTGDPDLLRPRDGD